MEDARQALRSYDYIAEGNRWYHRLKHNTTQSWEESGEGFIRYDPENGGWYRVPYKVKSEFKFSGLDFRNPTHEVFFGWLWPVEHVTMIYHDAWVAKKAYAEERQLAKNQVIVEQAKETIEEAREIIESHTPEPDSEPEKKSFLDKLFGN
jgi:hypothetical protein